MCRIRKTSIVASALGLLSAIAVHAQNYTIDWHTIDGGGHVFAAGGGYDLSGSIGQFDAGVAMTGGDYTLAGGFWPGAAAYAVGDLNCDGVVNLFDIDPFVLALISMQNGVPEAYYDVYPDCDIMLADTDADGTVTLFDIDPFVELLTAK